MCIEIARKSVLALTVAAILLTTMAMWTVAGSGVEVTATHPDILVRTPLARQILADGRIGYSYTQL